MERPVICFDWDGTIADSMPLCIGEIRLALQRMGLPDLPDEQIRKCNGPTYEQSVPILGIPDERAEEFLRTRTAAELEIVPTVQRLFPGIRELLADLRTRAELVIVSNGLVPYLDLSIRVLDLEDVFVRREAFQPGRAKPDALRQVIDEMQPTKVVMVGDRLGDIEAGRACGIPTIACAFGYGDETEWAHADQTVFTVDELHAALLRFLAD